MMAMVTVFEMVVVEVMVVQKGVIMVMKELTAVRIELKVMVVKVMV